MERLGNRLVSGIPGWLQNVVFLAWQHTQPLPKSAPIQKTETSFPRLKVLMPPTIIVLARRANGLRVIRLFSEPITPIPPPRRGFWGHYQKFLPPKIVNITSKQPICVYRISFHIRKYFVFRIVGWLSLFQTSLCWTIQEYYHIDMYIRLENFNTG